MVRITRKPASDTKTTESSYDGRPLVDALGGLALRGLGVAQGFLLTILLVPSQRGQVALAMSTMVVVAQLAPLGADHAIAVSGRRPSLLDTSPRLRTAALVGAACAFVLVTRGRSWPTTSNHLTALWAVAAIAAPIGVVVVADIQRKGQHLRRIVAQAIPLVLGTIGLALVASIGRFSASTALTVLAGAAIVALPLRMAINASTVESGEHEPAAGFNRTASSYLAVHIPAMSIQRADLIVLAVVSSMGQAGLYALAASVAFLQTAVIEQVLKREVSSGQPSTRQAWGWAIASYLLALLLLMSAVVMLPEYAGALTPGIVLCTGWFVHFAAYRHQVLAIGVHRSSTPLLFAVAHLMAAVVLAGRFGATGAASAFLAVNALWLTTVLRADRA